MDRASRIDCISFKENKQINKRTNTKTTNQPKETQKITRTKQKKTHKQTNHNNTKKRTPKINPKPTKQKNSHLFNRGKGNCKAIANQYLTSRYLPLTHLLLDIAFDLFGFPSPTYREWYSETFFTGGLCKLPCRQHLIWNRDCAVDFNEFRTG